MIKAETMNPCVFVIKVTKSVPHCLSPTVAMACNLTPVCSGLVEIKLDARRSLRITPPSSSAKQK
jgi:hypothetical protein